MAWFTKNRSTSNGVDDFDQQIRALVAKHASKDLPIVETDDDAIVIGDITTNLGNLRRAWTEHGADDRLPWLERTVLAFIDHKPIPHELDTSHLRPGVRSRTTFSIAGLRFAMSGDGFSDGNAPAMLPIAADLSWVLIWDTPATMGTINAAQIEEWGASFDDLLAVAKSNLAMEPFLGWSVANNSVYSPMGVDDYDGTRVLLPGALDFLPFDDERVIFMPTRNSCKVVSASDADGIAMAAELALTELDSAHQVSFTPIVGRDDQWRPLVLEPDHPAYASWRKLVTIDRLYGYDAQKGLLEDHLGDELFIAKFAALERNDGLVTSYCTWSDGVHTLLPVSDLVAFYHDDDETFLVPWSAAVEVVGHLLEPTDHYPERFRVTKFPSQAERSILRSLSVEL